MKRAVVKRKIDYRLRFCDSNGKGFAVYDITAPNDASAIQYVKTKAPRRSTFLEVRDRARLVYLRTKPQQETA